MSHAEMIEKAFRVIHQFTGCGCSGETGHAMDVHLATEILDAILPQVTTVEELEALPDGTVLIDIDGNPWVADRDIDGQRLFLTPAEHEGASWPKHVWRAGPLTVVWSPS